MKHLCLQSMYINSFTFYSANVISRCIIWGVSLNKTVIPFPFVGDEMIIVNLASCALLTILCMLME